MTLLNAELSLQRIEAQAQLVLSRQIGMPNIAAKGKLQPRTVSIPSFLAPQDAEAKAADTLRKKSHSMQKPLIEEIVTSGSSGFASQVIPKPKGILKGSSAQVPRKVDQTPMWSWSWSWSRSNNDRLQIQIEVPPMVRIVASFK